MTWKDLVLAWADENEISEEEIKRYETGLWETMWDEYRKSIEELLLNYMDMLSKYHPNELTDILDEMRELEEEIE